MAREMSKLKIVDERRQREIEKMCAESDELKQLQAHIRHAYLNKERAAQSTETQYRRQQDLEQDAAIDATYLKIKEDNDTNHRSHVAQKTSDLVGNKQFIQD